MLKLASSLGFAYGVANLKRRIRAAVNQAVLAAIALVFLLGAVVFALIALHIWLSGEIGPVASAGIIAAVLLVVATVLLLVARRQGKGQPRAEDPAAQMEQMEQTLQQGYARLAQAGGGSPWTNPVVLGMAAALVAGILLGRRT